MEAQRVTDDTPKRNNPFLFLLPFAFCLLTLLTGCVQYDVGVNFDSQTHGAIVQHIKLGERLSSFSSETAQDWLKSVERRVRSLQGRTKRISSQEVVVTIPFNNGAELEKKFNEFFNPVDPANTRTVNSSEMELPQFNCHLSVKQNNLLFVLRNRLRLELDLRSLSLLSTKGSVLVSPGALLDLEFRLNTPWGAQSIETATDAIAPEISQQGQQLIWKLKPGEINDLEAVFWLPSSVGIGAAIIALLVAVGIFLKYRLLPAIGIGKRQQVAGNKA